jgi:hypothetical protein
MSKKMNTMKLVIASLLTVSINSAIGLITCVS